MLVVFTGFHLLPLSVIYNSRFILKCPPQTHHWDMQEALNLQCINARRKFLSFITAFILITQFIGAVFYSHKSALPLCSLSLYRKSLDSNVRVYTFISLFYICFSMYHPKTCHPLENKMIHHKKLIL